MVWGFVSEFTGYTVQANATHAMLVDWQSQLLAIQMLISAILPHHFSFKKEMRKHTKTLHSTRNAPRRLCSVVCTLCSGLRKRQCATATTKPSQALLQTEAPHQALSWPWFKPLSHVFPSQHPFCPSFFPPYKHNASSYDGRVWSSLIHQPGTDTSGHWPPNE